MTREEAAEFTRKLVARAEINAFPKTPKTINNIPVFYFEAVLSALRGPQPDPGTGLLPCGCGGKAIPARLPHPIKTLTCVACETCFVTTPYLEDDEAKDVWNRAMGWKGGAE